MVWLRVTETPNNILKQDRRWFLCHLITCTSLESLLPEVFVLQELSILFLHHPWIWSLPLVQDGWLPQSHFSHQAGRKKGDVPFSGKSRTWKLHAFFLSRPHLLVPSYLTTTSCEGIGKCGLYPEWVFCPVKVLLWKTKEEMMGRLVSP